LIRDHEQDHTKYKCSINTLKIPVQTNPLT